MFKSATRRYVPYLLLVTLACLLGSALGATADGSSTTASDVGGLEAAAPSSEAVGESGTATYTLGRCAGYVEIEPATAVVFVVVALLIGLICYHALAWIPVPYTALLLVGSMPP